MKICLLYPFFGQLPLYFKMFLHSCTRNPAFDFVFIGDCFEDVKNHCGQANVRFFAMSKAEFSRLMSTRLSLQVNLHRPYKLCDYKPAYGDIFADFATGYDFWGFGDIDVVLGRLEEFFTARVLADYDIINCVDFNISGSLCLFRNTPEATRLYRKVENYQAMFEDDSSYLFEEAQDYFPRTVRMAAESGELRVLFADLAKEKFEKNEIVEYRQGRIISLFTGREYAYLHYIGIKRLPFFSFPRGGAAWDDCYFSRYGMWKHKWQHNILSGFIARPLQVWRNVGKKYDTMKKMIRAGKLRNTWSILRDRIFGKI